MDTPLTRAEIDLNAYAHNIRELKRITQSKARLTAVVKANCYGRGARESAQNLFGMKKAGCRMKKNRGD